MENRYKLLSEEKVRSEMEGRTRLDRGMDEIADCRKQIEDLKYMLSEKSRQNMELQDEMGRSKRVLDEKFFEAGKTRDESNAKGDQVVDLRAQVAELERDIDLVKSQRADMFREITRMRDCQDMKTKESLDQHDRMKALEYDLQKTLIRIEETNKQVEARSFEIRNKNLGLDDNEKEIARLRDLNSQQNVEIVALRRDVDRISADCYDYRKNIEATDARNVDASGKIRSIEIQSKEKEDGLYQCKKDIENQQYTNTNMRNDLNDYLAEKEALERHSRILLGQNDDLTKELERFVNTDEVLRQQLDRRGRVVTMQERNYKEMSYSNAKVTDARSRSPAKHNNASSFAGRDSSPPRQFRGNSPLRSSYKATYNY